MKVVENNQLEGVNSRALAKERRKEGRLFFNLSLPSLITILIVVFIPVFWLSSLSFFDRAGDLSWANYDRIFQSQLYIKTFIVTLKISFITLFFCILLGYPLCYWLSQLPDRLAGILMIFVLLPFWTSILVRTYAWLVILQRNGIINDTLIGGGKIQMLAQRIDSTIMLYSNWGAASALGVVLLILAFVTIWVFNRAFGIDKLFMR